MFIEPQFPINGGQFRIDFAHPATFTAIELDGYAYHHTAEQLTRDYQRQHYLESLGWHFIRFTGRQIHRDCAGCVNTVRNHILGRLAQLQPAPYPAPQPYSAFPATGTGATWAAPPQDSQLPPNSQNPNSSSRGDSPHWEWPAV